MDDGTTYHENFLLSVEFLPNDIRRDFELIKDLDRESIDITKELNDQEKEYLNRVKILRNENKNEANDNECIVILDNIKNLRQRVKQRLSEKTAIATNLSSDLDRITRKLDSDLAFFETELRSCGDFERTVKGAEPGSDVCVRPSLEETDMILGRVIAYHADIGSYDIADVDDSRRYSLPESQVVILDLADKVIKLSKGEEVFAVYPDTTSFYPALVLLAPRKSTLLGMEPLVTVQFHGDADELGITHPKFVPLRFVIRPPAFCMS